MAASAFRDYLRHGTHSLHQRVDDAFSRFDLASERGVRGFLAAQAAALLPLERALEAGCEGGASAIIPDWDERCRSHLLDGLVLDYPVLDIEPYDTREPMLGALYVLEGSKLGARFLLKRALRADGPFSHAATLFLAHDAGAGRWASFLDHLDRHADPLCHAAALDGAVAAFALFHTAASRVANQQDHRSENLLFVPSPRLAERPFDHRDQPSPGLMPWHDGSE